MSMLSCQRLNQWCTRNSFTPTSAQNKPQTTGIKCTADPYTKVLDVHEVLK